MKRYFITFRSVTPAQRGERVLRSAGVECQLQRTPKWMEQRGCGYCLRLRGDVDRCVELLRRSGVAYSKVYTQDLHGGVEELVL